MVSTVADRIHELFTDRFGDAVRSVGYYADDGGEVVYIREDVEARYERGDIDRVFHDARLEAIDQPHQESLYVHGELQCTVRIFENATELHIVESETAGIIVAVDAGTIDDLRGTIDVCLDATAR